MSIADTKPTTTDLMVAQFATIVFTRLCEMGESLDCDTIGRVCFDLGISVEFCDDGGFVSIRRRVNA